MNKLAKQSITDEKTDRTKRKFMAKAQNQPKNRALLTKLAEAADAASKRVSGYSDSQRATLEQLARKVIQGVRVTSFCSH